jgi:sec-independent protein translocase protein TatA
VGSIGPFQIIIIALVILVLFGRGRISEMMGDFGKGVKSFRKGLNDDDDKKPESAPAQRIESAHHEAKPASQAAADPQPASDKTNH